MLDSNIGARKQRNIKNHLFIIYGVINNVIRDNLPCIDLQIYDIMKAFDALWLEDCMNDLYDSLHEDSRDDKVVTIYLANQDNLVAVNTAVGLTDRVNIKNIVQQGGTWGSLLCSNSIDSVCRKARSRSEHIYFYKNKAPVFILGMVDDILGVSKCGSKSEDMNNFINTQIEMKKLSFHTPDINGKSKCKVLHIGKLLTCSSDLRVHGTLMGQVNEANYLGDILSNDGKNSKNIKDRISKGMGIITQIMNILESVSFGEHYFEIAKLLRETMFINGILTNSEVWYNLSIGDIKELEQCDKFLLMKLFQASNSTPTEAFYLELGILPILVIIKARRINYFHYIICRNEAEMLTQFFYTQWFHPSKGDWTEQVKIDLNDFKISSDLQKLKTMTKNELKNIVKKQSQIFAF